MKKENNIIRDVSIKSPVLDVSITELNELLEELRPYIAMDGGDIQVIAIKDLTVFVKLYGACDGCSQVGMTLQYGVEDLLKDKVHPDLEVCPVYGDDEI